MLIDSLAMPADAFAAGTGWAIKPEGACRGGVCVPLGDAVAGDTIDVAAAADRLGMAVVEHDGMWAVGPASVTGRAIADVEAPELTLPLALSDGVWRLADQRGRRTVIVAWAPW